jgi:uncharacterized protein (DUF58 family)
MPQRGPVTRARGAAPPQPRFRFLEPHALDRLRHLRLAARRIVEGSFAGRHRSRIRGTSVEFADYREYSPGDDLRRLDWKALARLGRPYLRTYDEETNLRCVFLLDTSASMDFGAQAGVSYSKLDYARYLLAAMAYLVVQSRDQAGLALGADRLDQFIPPHASFAHLDRICHALEQVAPAPRTDLAALLDALFPHLRRRSLLILCSDFLVQSPTDLFRALRLYRHRQFEVILFHLIDPRERDLPDGPAFRFLDPEGPSAADASPAEIREGYRARLEAFCRDLRRQALGCGCDYERVETDEPYPDALRRYLQFRETL